MRLFPLQDLGTLNSDAAAIGNAVIHSEVSWDMGFT